MSSKIIGAFKKGQNGFRKIVQPLYFLKKRLDGKEEDRMNKVFCLLFGGLCFASRPPLTAKEYDLHSFNRHVSTIDFEKYFWEEKGMPLYFSKKRLGGKEEERINSLPLSISQEKDRTRKKREVVFNYIVVTRSYRDIRHTGYMIIHIVKLEVQYMTLDVCIDLLAAYFKLG